MGAQRKSDLNVAAEGEAMLSVYDVDLHAWANEQAALLRAGRFAAADMDNIAEEIEALARTEKRELISRLAVVLLHLLKWRFQPKKRSRSWIFSIKEHRTALAFHLRDNPSLKSSLTEAVADAYSMALIKAQRETRLSEKAFPPLCPFTFQQIMDDGFWPQ